MSVVDIGAVESFGFDKDPIVIRKYIAGYQQGKVLDVTDFTEEYIRKGHVIIYNPTTEVYKPMPVASGKYSTLPSGYEYVGVACATKSKKEPFVAIMYSGEVNDVASPFDVEPIKAALKTAVPTLVFKHD
jgi:hypothetical protein